MNPNSLLRVTCPMHPRNYGTMKEAWSMESDRSGLGSDSSVKKLGGGDELLSNFCFSYLIIVMISVCIIKSIGGLNK